MGRPQRNEYRDTIRLTREQQLYTQAALADLAIEQGLIHPEERHSAKTGFYRCTQGLEPDAFVKIKGMGGRFPAWYGSTLKEAL